jgi:hypothetical protein
MGSGCAGISQLPEAEKGLNITESTYAVGAASEANNGEIQVFSYNYTLYNQGPERVYIDTAEPLFKKDFLTKVIPKQHKILVNKTLEPDSSILIGGQVEFNASNLTKEQISSLEPYIYAINITSTKTIAFPKA